MHTWLCWSRNLPKPLYPQGGTPEIYKQGQEDAFAIITAIRTNDQDLVRMAIQPIIDGRDDMRVIFCMKALAGMQIVVTNSVARHLGRDPEEFWREIASEFHMYYFNPDEPI